MAEISEDFIEMVNKPGRIGILATADADGKPNAAYFGSPRFRDGLFSLGLAGGRTLANLEANPHAVFFCVEEGPVSFSTPGCRLYLKVREIQTEGRLLEQIREEIAEYVSPEAAYMIQASVAFEVTETRNMVDFG